MIEFKNVNIQFKEKKSILHAVKDVSLKIEKGDVYGIVGGSGAGKSTLLRTVNLLQPVTSGEVFVDGKNITGYKHKAVHELRKNIGMIFQHFNLASSKTVYQNIAFSLENAGWKKADIEKRVDELLEFVGIPEKKSVYPGRLSGGQKQRVAIARALANNTEILLCDEPTSALDAETTNSVLKLLKEVNKKLGVTIVIITHELDVVKTICNKVTVMNKGEVVETGDVYEIFTNPKEEFTAQLIGHSSKTDLPVQLVQSLDGKVLRLVYKGAAANDSVLSEASRKFDSAFNILYGKIEYIGDNPFGVLYVNVHGKDEDEAVEFLKEKVFKVEEVK